MAKIAKKAAGPHFVTVRRNWSCSTPPLVEGAQYEQVGKGFMKNGEGHANLRTPEGAAFTVPDVFLANVR